MTYKKKQTKERFSTELQLTEVAQKTYEKRTEVNIYNVGREIVDGFNMC